MKTYPQYAILSLTRDELSAQLADEAAASLPQPKGTYSIKRYSSSTMRGFLRYAEKHPEFVGFQLGRLQQVHRP